MTDVYDLKQVSDNSWQAKYQGNYGKYTIKLTLDEKFKVIKYSCTCPSDYSPCKHIGFVVAEIKKNASKVETISKKNKVTVSEVLQNVSLSDLRNFIIEKAKYNTELTNEIILKFADKKILTTNENFYSEIIANILNDVECDVEDYDEYGEYEIDLSFFEDWISKANNAINKSEFRTAELICKACIQEYANWAHNLDFDIDSFIYSDYQEDFFDILEKMVINNQIDKKSLYTYCKQELNFEKYNSMSSKSYFNNLMGKIAGDVNPDDFESYQLLLIKNLNDKSGYEAKTIYHRLIDFYKTTKQNEKIESLIENNLQIDDFRVQVIEKRIANSLYADAKKLINERLEIIDTWRNKTWKDLLLKVAQNEKDIHSIRKISYEFLVNDFDITYFKIYKKTFSNDEWSLAFDRLFNTYNKPLNKWDNGFKTNVAELLKAEKLNLKLLEYIEHNGSIQNTEQYFSSFSDAFPDRTLSLFKIKLNQYLENNLGRDHYNYANGILRKMRKIEGGISIVAQMVQNYRVIYKNRRAMMEILNQL